MSRIKASDERFFPYPHFDVYRTLCDFGRYGDWWPRSVPLEVLGPLPAQIGTRVRLRSTPFVRWVATVVELELNRLIRLLYSGPLLGEARWTLTPAEGGTRVGYEIDLELVPLWLRLASRFLDLGREHRRRMHDVFLGLYRGVGLERER